MNNYWLLLEKSDDTRVSKGIDSYLDKTGEVYKFDSYVPNHKQITLGDYAILRRNNRILGFGLISAIDIEDTQKIHRRCPKCQSTDSRERRTKHPKWKCGKCAFEFSMPVETIIDVKSYTAYFSSFVKFNISPKVDEIKECAETGNGKLSQLSMIKLNKDKIKIVLSDLAFSNPETDSLDPNSGQGYGLSHEERRAVELHAMNIATEQFLRNGWKVVNKSSSRPFDLLIIKDKQRRFIEVKGTTSKGSSIILTAGEIEHAKTHSSESVLYVVTNIQLNNIHNKWIATGGVANMILDPWIIDDNCLTATQYRYVLTKIN